MTFARLPMDRTGSARQWGWFLLLVIGPEQTSSVPKITLIWRLHCTGASFLLLLSSVSRAQAGFSFAAIKFNGVSLPLSEAVSSNVGRNDMCSYYQNQTIEMRVGRKANRRFDNWRDCSAAVETV